MLGSGTGVPTLGTGDRGEGSAWGLATPRGTRAHGSHVTLQAGVHSGVKGDSTCLAEWQGQNEVI